MIVGNITFAPPYEIDNIFLQLLRSKSMVYEDIVYKIIALVVAYYKAKKDLLDRKKLWRNDPATAKIRYGVEKIHLLAKFAKGVLHIIQSDPYCRVDECHPEKDDDLDIPKPSALDE